MYVNGYWITTCPDHGIERVNPQTGKPEICDGYYCEIYSDSDYEDLVDWFCLAEGYEIPDTSEESLEVGVKAYMNPYPEMSL